MKLLKVNEARFGLVHPDFNWIWSEFWYPGKPRTLVVNLRSMLDDRMCDLVDIQLQDVSSYENV